MLEECFSLEAHMQIKHIKMFTTTFYVLNRVSKKLNNKMYFFYLGKYTLYNGGSDKSIFDTAFMVENRWKHYVAAFTPLIDRLYSLRLRCKILSSVY